MTIKIILRLLVISYSLKNHIQNYISYNTCKVVLCIIKNGFNTINTLSCNFSRCFSFKEKLYLLFTYVALTSNIESISTVTYMG